MLGLYVAGASALVAVIVQGSVGDAATFGFVLGGIWGITRGPLTKIHAESDAPENDTNAQEEPEDKPKLTLLPRP
jgi:hypothetical protein